MAINENHMTEYVTIKDMDHNGKLDLVLVSYSNVISCYENMMGANKGDIYFTQLWIPSISRTIGTPLYTLKWQEKSIKKIGILIGC